MLYGFIKVYLPADELGRMIPGQPLLAALTGCLLGLFLPVGDGGTLPVVHALLSKKTPPAFVVAFLVSAPSFNLVAIFGTLAVFGAGPIFWGRIGMTLLIALIIGLLFYLEMDNPLLRILPLDNHDNSMSINNNEQPIGPDKGDAGDTKIGVDQALKAAIHEFFLLGSLLILGSTIAAVLRSLVPQAIMLHPGYPPIIQVSSLATLSLLYSSSSMENAFTASGIAGSLAYAPLLAFIVLGPIIDIKRIPLFLSIFRPRIAILFILAPVLMVILLSIFIAYLFA